MHRNSGLLVGLLALAVAACTAGPPRPGQYLARNDLQVVPLNDGTFEVIARPGTVGRGYFCAAADYARVRLGARASDRVVVRADRVGANFTVAHARALCPDLRPDGFFGF